MNAGEPEGVNKYLTGYLGSSNQWGSNVSLHTMPPSVLLFFYVQNVKRSGAYYRDVWTHVIADDCACVIMFVSLVYHTGVLIM